MRNKKDKPELPDAVLEFFRNTGRTGGLKRAENLSAQQRSEQARKAVQARWAKAKGVGELTKSHSRKLGRTK